MKIIQLHNILILISNGHYNLTKGDCIILDSSAMILLIKTGCCIDVVWCKLSSDTRVYIMTCYFQFDFLPIIVLTAEYK